MSCLNILGTSLVGMPEAQKLLARPELRKATRNMAMGAAAIEMALTPMQSLFEQTRAQWSLILTTNTGELETTVDFLKTLHQTRVARPFLFQNSLHNSTAGFFAIQFQLTAPVMTFSSRPFAEEQALDMAEVLIRSRQCDYCFVLSLDIWPTFEDVHRKHEPPQAACMLVTTPENTPPLVQPLAHLSKVTIEEDLQNLQAYLDEPWEPTPACENALLVLAQQIKNPAVTTVQIEKKHWGRSSIEWTPT